MIDLITSSAEEYADTVPELHRGGYVRAAGGECPPRAAIKAFCLYCVGYVRQDVTACAAVTCPLYAYRPYQTSRRRAEGARRASEEASEEGGLV